MLPDLCVLIEKVAAAVIVFVEFVFGSGIRKLHAVWFAAGIMCIFYGLCFNFVHNLNVYFYLWIYFFVGPFYLSLSPSTSRSRSSLGIVIVICEHKRINVFISLRGHFHISGQCVAFVFAFFGGSLLINYEFIILVMKLLFTKIKPMKLM